MSLDKELKNILDHIFLNKKTKLAKSSARSILDIYLDKKLKKIYRKSKNSYLVRKLDTIEQYIITGNIDSLIPQFINFVNSEDVKTYISNSIRLKNSSFSKLSNIKGNIEKLKLDIRKECIRYITKHPGTIPSKFVNKIQGESVEKYESSSKKRSKNKQEKEQKAIEKNREEEIVNICDSVYETKYNDNIEYSREVLEKSSDYADCLYEYRDNKRNKIIHRIVIGKKELVGNKKLVEYELSKIAEGKTKEKYEYIREDNNGKKEFSYRYEVYCNKVNDDTCSQLDTLHLAPKILEKLGYSIRYTGDKTKSPAYGSVGIGTFNIAYEENNKNKTIKRVIKICISNYDTVINIRKGNKQAFENISKFDTNGKSLKELFYKNKDSVFNKNKEFGEVSDVLKDEEFKDKMKNLWYCVSTSEFKNNQEIDRFNVLIDICNSIYKNNYNSSNNYSRRVLKKSLDCADCLYISKDEEDEIVYRIIVGKKQEVSNKKLVEVEYELSKIAEGKTKEKYEYTRENNEKKEFSYRYKVYCNEVIDASDLTLNLTALNHASTIFKELGYKIKYTNKKYGALGIGSFNAAYEEDNKNKMVKRIVKICISSRDVVLKERKGNKQGCKAFENIKELSTNGRNLRELFYQNEDLVLSKNKEFGQISDIIDITNLKDDEKNLWYCIATSEFRGDGDAEKFNDEDVKKFNDNETEKLIELQAFTKGILNGLVKMHKQGIVHLDVKPENTLKKSSGNKSAPYYKYSLTDFGTAIDINKRIKEVTKYSQKLNWQDLLFNLPIGTWMYGRNDRDVAMLKKMSEAKPELIYKLDSFAVATSMCAFYKFYLTGKSNKTKDQTEGGYRFPWQFQEQHAKGIESALVTWLPQGPAQDLAKNLMESNLEKRWSCEKALGHPFIKMNLNPNIRIGAHREKYK